MNPSTLRRSRGGAALEMLLCLPLLLLLAYPVTDVARIFQANAILTNIAREGANLASRTSGQEQAIMASLAATAPPLDMQANGMIHITRILAFKKNGSTQNVVVGQQRWRSGSYAPTKGVWTCGAAGTHWDLNGNCVGLPSPDAAPAVNVMQGALNDGDVIYLVEVFYRFPVLFSGFDFGGISVPSFDSSLYAMTIF